MYFLTKKERKIEQGKVLLMILGSTLLAFAILFTLNHGRIKVSDHQRNNRINKIMTLEDSIIKNKYGDRRVEMILLSSNKNGAIIKVDEIGKYLCNQTLGLYLWDTISDQLILVYNCEESRICIKDSLYDDDILFISAVDLKNQDGTHYIIEKIQDDKKDIIKKGKASSHLKVPRIKNVNSILYIWYENIDEINGKNTVHFEQYSNGKWSKKVECIGNIPFFMYQNKFTKVFSFCFFNEKSNEIESVLLRGSDKIKYQDLDSKGFAAAYRLEKSQLIQTEYNDINNSGSTYYNLYFKWDNENYYLLSNWNLNYEILYLFELNNEENFIVVRDRITWKCKHYILQYKYENESVSYDFLEIDNSKFDNCLTHAFWYKDDEAVLQVWAQDKNDNHIVYTTYNLK